MGHPGIGVVTPEPNKLQGHDFHKTLARCPARFDYEENDMNKFEKLYASVTNEVVIEDRFHNGTGYFDNFELSGDVVGPVKGTDGEGRKVIAMRVVDHHGISGTFVVHERYVDDPAVTWSRGRGPCCDFGPMNNASRLGDDQLFDIAIVMSGGRLEWEEETWDGRHRSGVVALAPAQVMACVGASL